MQAYHFELNKSTAAGRITRWCELHFPLETHYGFSYSRGYKQHVLTIFFDSEDDETAFIEKLRALVRAYDDRELFEAGGEADSPT